jgi:hypothetical protein
MHATTGVEGTDGVNAGNMELTLKFFVFLAGLTTLSGIAELVVYRAVLTFTGKM